jgi:antitoxin ParD1/3/4
VNLSIPPELQTFVEAQVAAGAYASPSEVVGDALRLLHFHERERAALIQDLRARIAVGLDELDRGESIEADQVFAELRQRNSNRAAGPQS